MEQEKLDQLKRRDRYAFLMSLDTPEHVADGLGAVCRRSRGGIEMVERYYAALDRVTPDDILEAARKYLVPERRTMVVLKGEGGKAEGTEGGRPEVAAAGRPPTSESAAPTPQSPAPNRRSVPRKAPGGPVLLPVADDPTVSFRIWFQVGSQDDPPGKEGLAAVTASMLGEGSTAGQHYEQILDLLFPLAAGYSAQSDMEMTVISGRVHKDNLAAFLSLS